MIYLTCKNLELRGIVNKTSNKGNVYYVLYVENEDGKPFNFYVPNGNAFPEGLKKGDKITVTFELSFYKGSEKLTVCKVGKVS